MGFEILKASGIFASCKTEEENLKRLNYLEENGILDFLEEISYTILVFGDGKFLLFPEQALPLGLTGGDRIEITIRRLTDER